MLEHFAQRRIHAAPLIGCCGWAGAQQQYFAQFPTIEIQSTFYDPPAPKIAARWRAIAPPGFVFCIKAWQLITHPASSPTYRRLRRPINTETCGRFGFFQETEEVWQAWKNTLEIAEVLQAAVVLFQCPASFRSTAENIQNLSHFFQKVGSQYFRLAWEPRGPWPPETIAQLCAEHNLIHCVDPMVSHSLYSGPLYWRLHGVGSYSYRYSDEGLARLKDLLVLAQTEQPAYVFFNNVSMKDDANRFRELLTSDAIILR